MQRRKFIASSSVIGLATSVKSAPIVSSVFSSFNSQVLLQEFGSESKAVFNRFKSELLLNFKSLGLSQKMVNSIIMPIEIVKNTVTKFNEEITYKNKAGDFIILSFINGNDKIEIKKSLS